MNHFSTWLKLIFSFVLIVGLVLIFFLVHNCFLNQSSSPLKSPSPSNAITVVSTSPSPLENSTIFPTQSISVSFNQPISNGPDLKLRIDPPVDFAVNLSSDKKTVTISFKKPLDLGQGYTLFVPADAKFDGGKTLGQDYVYHFATIAYTGV